MTALRKTEPGQADVAAGGPTAGTEGPVELKDRPVQLRGSPIAKAMLRMAGWRLDFEGLPGLQGVLAVYPHTSNWDFPVGLTAKWAMGLPAAFWGKDTLFKVPLFGRWMRWLGGVPVDRNNPRGIVGDMVQRMQAAREARQFLWLALAPEGTRSLGPGWRSGFYRVAVQAGVPVAVVHLDYGRKRIWVNTFLQLSGNAEADMAAIAAELDGVRGLRAEQAAPIRLV